MTIHADPQRYYAVFSPEGVQYSGWRQCEFALDKGDLTAGWHIREAVMTPTTEHARLLAIEAAARNAMENSWQVDSEYDDWRDCTVLDPKDAQELRDTFSAASAATTQGDEG